MSSSSSDEGPATAPVAKARASSPDLDAAVSMKPWLEKLVDAFLNIPVTDPEKGISVQRIRKYLKEKYHVSKAQMKEIYAPTMRTAMDRKLIIKTTALRSVGVGSARLNPALAISRLQQNQEHVTAAAAAEEEKIVSRKRRATSDDDVVKTGSVKRRLPFGKNY